MLNQLQMPTVKELKAKRSQVCILQPSRVQVQVYKQNIRTAVFLVFLVFVHITNKTFVLHTINT